MRPRGIVHIVTGFRRERQRLSGAQQPRLICWAAPEFHVTHLLTCPRTAPLTALSFHTTIPSFSRNRVGSQSSRAAGRERSPRPVKRHLHYPPPSVEPRTDAADQVATPE